MNEKLSFPNLVDALSAKSGVSKKVAETFAKSFFDTIVEALYMGESSIKVKSLGIFRLVDVDSRESVNVSNGERIVIPGYKKVSFTPDDSVVEALNMKDNSSEDDNLAGSFVEANDENKSSQILEDNVQENVTLKTFDDSEVLSETDETDDSELDDVTDTPEDVGQEADEHVLKIVNDVTISDVEKTDSLSHIDMLISTPESVDEVKQQLALAAVKSDEAIALAKEANRERMRLELLLSRLEDNSTPESDDHQVDYNEEIGTDLNTSCADTEDSPSDEEASETENDDDSDESSLDEVALTDSSEDVVEEHVIVGEDNALNRLIARKAIESQGAISSHQDDRDDDRPTIKRGTRIAIWIIASVFVVALITCVIFFLRKTSESIESVKQLPAVEEKTSNPLDSLMLLRDSMQQQDSIVSSVEDSINNVSDSEKQSNEDKNSKEQNNEIVKESSSSKTTDSHRPKTHVVKPGESLTRISLRYYNTKDSVMAIIRANSFPDPDNVPVGAIVKLP